MINDEEVHQWSKTLALGNGEWEEIDGKDTYDFLKNVSRALTDFFNLSEEGEQFIKKYISGHIE